MSTAQDMFFFSFIIFILPPSGLCGCPGGRIPRPTLFHYHPQATRDSTSATRKCLWTFVHLGIPRLSCNTNRIYAGRSGDLVPFVIYHQVHYNICKFLVVHFLISSPAINVMTPTHNGMSRTCKPQLWPTLIKRTCHVISVYVLVWGKKITDP